MQMLNKLNLALRIDICGIFIRHLRCCRLCFCRELACGVILVPLGP